MMPKYSKAIERLAADICWAGFPRRAKGKNADCLQKPCRSPVACSAFGFCRRRNIAKAKADCAPADQPKVRTPNQERT